MLQLFGKKNKLKSFTAHVRRAASPPSPGSFTSPEFGDNNGEGSSVDSSADNATGSSTFARSHLRVPPLQLDFESRESLSEWFPASLLQDQVLTNPPNRDASLRAELSQFRNDTELERPLWNVSREKLNFSMDDIIVIEPERPAPEPSSNSQAEPETSATEPASPHAAEREASPGPGLVRRPVPDPITIPLNPTTSRVRIHRSPSVGANSSPFLRQRDSPAASRAASRPVSSYSDDISSAVSGTTLARDLGSFIITGNSRDSRYRYTLTRQDSATLPKGEHALIHASSPYWRDKRISNGEVVVSPEYVLGSPVPPVPPIPTSAELSAMASDSARSSKRSSRRRNSIAGDEVAMRTHGREEPSDKQTEATASGNYVPRHRRANSLSRISNDQIPMSSKRFSRISEVSASASPSPTTSAKSTYSATQAVRSLRESYRKGRASFDGVPQEKSSSSVNLIHSEVPVVEEHEPEPSSSNETADESGPSQPATAAMSFTFSPEPPTTAESGSLYSSSSAGKRSYTTNATSVKSPGSASLYPNMISRDNSPRFQRSPSERGPSRSSTHPRPTITLPYGDRPHSVQVPYTASPLSSRTSEESVRDARLPFCPRPTQGPPSTSSRVGSPDLIDMMFGGVVQPVRKSPSSRKRSGSQPAPMIFSPELSSSEHSLSSDSPSTASAARQTFPETPYAFTPYTSSAFVQPPLPSSAHMPSPRMVPRSGKKALSSAQFYKHMSVSVASTSGSSNGSKSAKLPMSPPLHSANGSIYSIASDPGSWSMGSGTPASSAQAQLGSIEESSVPPTPLTQTIPSRSRTSSPARATNNNQSQDQGQTVTVPTNPRTQPSPQLLPAPTRANTATPPPSLLPADLSPSLRSTAPDSRPVSTLNSSRPVSLVPSKRPLSPAPSTSSAPLSPVPSQVSHASELLSILREPSPIQEDSGPLPPYFERGSQPPHTEQLPPPYLATAASEPVQPQPSASPPPPSIPLPPPSLPVAPSPLPLPSTSMPLPPPSPRRQPPPQPLPPIPPHPTSPPPPPPPVQSQSQSHPLPPQPMPPTEPLPLPRPGRMTFARPAAPMGPRRPSAPTLLSVAASRARAGSVSSTMSISSGRSGPSRQFSTPMSASSPRFQTSPIKFRGLTMEAAQWTFTSEQLQAIVSSAIKSSADASAIRLLPLNVLKEELPAEIERLENLSADLRMNYKVAVRKRKTRLDDLSNMATGDMTDPAAAARMLQELSDIGEHMDHLAEELYNVSDQLGQLKHLQDTHSSSALAMVLRKLNTSLVKHMTNNKNLKEQLATLEAERDEAWAKAQEVAFELEEMQERLHEHGIATPLSSKENSRPSSRITLARKSSLRTSKAGLRSPSRIRSQRSSVTSSLYRNSLVGSPAARSSYHVPPVPRLPIRNHPIGIVTSDLPSRSAGASSDVTPTSEVRAMVEAQEEIMELLGITDDSLQQHNSGSSLPRRRRSLSAVETTPTSPRLRRNSDTTSPDQRGPIMTDRAAVLAAIGMSSHEY